ncbi:MAG: transcription elongation factor GreA [Actinomycetota bacterium]|nr:transcription elongation factor GreA [Actinomycetota bacterium]
MSTEAGQQTTWLTQETYDRLSAELAEAKGPRRADIVAKIEAARDEGDLKENGGYHAAKDEQGKLEARIRQLTQLLRDARVGEAPTSSGVAGPGMVVEVVYEGDDEPERFLIGSREDKADIPVYSANSPLGLALTGSEVGEKVTYTLPNGSSMTVELLSAEPYTG